MLTADDILFMYIYIYIYIYYVCMYIELYAYMPVLSFPLYRMIPTISAYLPQYPRKHLTLTKLLSQQSNLLEHRRDFFRPRGGTILAGESCGWVRLQKGERLCRETGEFKIVTLFKAVSDFSQLVVGWNSSAPLRFK